MNDARPSSANGGGSEPALALQNVTKTYKQPRGDLTVLKDVTLGVKPGEMVALVGPSGAGKSTLLHIAGLLDRPTEGEVVLRGEVCSRLGDAERSRLRRRGLGFVYQYHHLMPEFSALENVIIPQMILGVEKRVAKARARELLEALGLKDRENHRPSRLSGGEQQRVAIAAGGVQRTVLPAGGRTYRQPRPGYRQHGVFRPAQPGSCRRHRGARGNPQYGTGAPDGPYRGAP